MTDRHRQRLLPIAALLTFTTAVPAAAQVSDAGDTARPPGWSLTPAIGVSEQWDDNVTLAGDGSLRVGDFITAVRPSAILGYQGRRTLLTGNYAGSFDFYRRQDQLNSTEHRGVIDLTHQLTRHVQLFAQDQAMALPTTSDALGVGVNVLRRRTTRMNTFRGGVNAAFSPRTSLTAYYATDWVVFEDDDEAPLGPLLEGGYSHGGNGELRHRVSKRVALGADYVAQRAIVGGGADEFTAQNALAVTEIALSRTVKATLGYGHGWLSAGRNGFDDDGPAFDFGLEWEGRRTMAALNYGRSFLPSFGFGGTFQNEELSASLRTTLSRWVTWSGRVGISDNDPLDPGNPSLRAVSAQTSLGWVVKRRVRLQLFAERLAQDSNVAGGHVTRTRAGFQASVFDTVRASR